MIESDVVECVISLGKNLFYNSIMESCLLVTNNKKPHSRIGKVLFIDAREELKREKTISYLLPEHIQKIHAAFQKYETEAGFSYVAELEEILKRDCSLNVPLYVKSSQEMYLDPNKAYQEWKSSFALLGDSMMKLFGELK